MCSALAWVCRSRANPLSMPPPSITFPSHLHITNIQISSRPLVSDQQPSNATNSSKSPSIPTTYPQTLPQQKPWHSGEMAMLIDSNYSNSSSNYYRKMSSENSKRSNTQASAYAVNAGTMALTGFHFSTSGGGAPAWYIL